MSTHRYKPSFVPVTAADIQSQIAPGIAVAIARGVQFLDVTLDNDAGKADLDEYMAFFGSAFVGSNPTTPVTAAPNPRGHVAAMGLAWTSVAETTVAAGVARSADNSFDIELSAPLLLDMPGKLDTGAEAPSTYFAVYVIGDSTGVKPTDGRYSTSFVAPVLPSGYDKYRRIGCVKNDAASNFMPFRQVWKDYVRRYWFDAGGSTTRVLNGGSAAVFTDVSLTAFVPPSALNALLRAAFTAGSGGSIADSLFVRPDGFTADPGPIVLRNAAVDAEASHIFECLCPGQIVEYKVSDDANDTASLFVIGFDDQL